MTDRRLLLDGETLSLEEIREVARGGVRVELAPEALARVERSRALVDRIAAGETPAYGINTGFGTLAEVRIDRKDLRTLQRNLLLSHAAGVGTPLPISEARALLQAQRLAVQEQSPVGHGRRKVPRGMPVRLTSRPPGSTG